MTKHQWTAIPSAWIQNGGLKLFQKDHPHTLAALKLYIVLACWAGKLEPSEEPGIFATVSPSFNELQNLSALDRSEIAPGLTLLEELALIKISRKRGQRSIYYLLGNHKKGWSKLPMSVVDSARLKGFSLKHTAIAVHDRKATLIAALKIYLACLGFRDARTNRAKISYDRLVEVTGVRRRGVRQALSLLMTHEMLHVENRYTETPEGLAPACNQYFIVGLSDLRFHPDPALAKISQGEAVA